MPAIEGKEAVDWIDSYVTNKTRILATVAEGLRRMMKSAVPGAKESVNPWRIPTFESNGPMCFFTVGKNHVTFGFLGGRRCRIQPDCWRERERVCGM
jgi:hypothetical protein